MGKPIQLSIPHSIYHQLGKIDKERQGVYRALFRGKLSERDLAAIRKATNKAWALGGNQFKAQIKAKTGRRPVSLGRGGDRKSAAFREGKNQ